MTQTTSNLEILLSDHSLIEASLKALPIPTQRLFFSIGAFFGTTITLELLGDYLQASPQILAGLHDLTISDAEIEMARLALTKTGGQYTPEQIRETLIKRKLKSTPLTTTKLEELLEELVKHRLLQKIAAETTFVADQDGNQQALTLAIPHYHLHETAYRYAHAQATEADKGRALEVCLRYSQKYYEPKLANFAALQPVAEMLVNAAEFSLAINDTNLVIIFATFLYSANGLGGFLMRTHDYDLSLRLLDLALKASRIEADKINEGVWLGNLGVVYAGLGQTETAINHYQQALEISRQLGDKNNEANWLGNLGNTYKGTKNLEFALDSYQQCLALHREINNQHGEANDLSNLGYTHYQLGQIEPAIAYYQQALVINRQIGDKYGEAADLNGLGLAYYELGQVENAIDCYQQALHISQHTGDKHTMGECLSNLGNAYNGLEQVETAIDYYRQAIKIRHEIGDKINESSNLGKMGNIYRSLGQPQAAIDYYQQALEISRQVGDKLNEGNSLGNLGGAYEQLENYPQALHYFDQTRTLFIEMDMSQLIAQTDENIARVQAKMGENK